MIAFGGATVAQLYRMVDLMKPGRMVDVKIFIGKTTRPEAQTQKNLKGKQCWCAVWQKF